MNAPKQPRRSRQEWVWLGNVGSYVGSDIVEAVTAVLRCRRVVEVRLSDKGIPGFYARVPLPRGIEQPAVRAMVKAS